MKKQEISEFDAILAVVTHPAAFEVGLFADLCICKMEDGRYSVARMPLIVNKKVVERGWERIYVDPRRAVRSYIKERHKMQLGFDWEHHLYYPDKYPKPG